MNYVSVQIHRVSMKQIELQNVDTINIPEDSSVRINVSTGLRHGRGVLWSLLLVIHSYKIYNS